MAEQNPLVSVVIVNYETSDMVKRCVDSLAGQGVPLEIIVVDNPSPANDVANLEGLPITIVRSANNVGYGRGCNAGAEKARGDFICILNPDTALPPGALSKWLEVFNRENRSGRKPGIVAPLLLNDNGTPQRSAYEFLNPINYWLYHSLLAGGLKKLRKAIRMESETSTSISRPGWVMGAAYLIPRQAWDAVGGFGDNYFLYGEDTDLCWRVKDAGYDVLYAPEVSITHTQGEPSPERRGLGALRLFTGIRIFLHQHYPWWKRWPVEACIVADMLMRIVIFLPLTALSGGKTLYKSRLWGYWQVLKLYLINA